jgi:hypothetical protein
MNPETFDNLSPLAISVDPGNTFVWLRGMLISYWSPLNGLDPLTLMPAPEQFIFRTRPLHPVVRDFGPYTLKRITLEDVTF